MQARNSFKSYIANSFGNVSLTSAFATMFFIVDIVVRVVPDLTNKFWFMFEKFFYIFFI